MALDLEMLIKAKAVLGTAQAEISKFLGSVEEQTERIGKSGEKNGTAFGQYFKSGFMIAGAAATAFAGTVVAVGAAVVALGQRGSAIDDTRGAFSQLTAEVGGSAASIATLRKATDGVVTDFELMDKTNKAFSLGLRLSQQDMALTGESARILADRVGVGVADAYGTLTMAMASGKDATLKQIGLNIDAKKATEDYAKALGIEASELNENQQILAKRGAILKAMREELEATGGAEADFADRIDQMQVAVQNFNDNLSVAIATSPVLNELLGFTADAIMGAFGDNQQDAITTMVSYVNKFAMVVVDAASVAVSFGKYAGMAFYGVRTIIFGVMAAVGDFALMVADVQLKIVEMASKVPGVGNVFKALGADLRSQREYFKGFNDSLHSTADQALTDAGNWAAGADKVNVSLGELRNKMTQLDAQGVSSSAVQAELSKRHTQTATSVGANSKAIENFTKKLTELDGKIANRSDLSGASLLSRFGEEAYKAVQAAADLGISFDSLPPKIRQLANEQGAKLLAETINSIPPAIVGIGDVLEELDKQMMATTGRSSKGWADLRDGMIDAQHRMSEAVMNATDRKLAEINRAEAAEIASFASLRVNDEAMYQARLTAVKGFYQRQRDEASGAASTIEARMSAMGVQTSAALAKNAADATRDYEQMKASGLYSAAAIQAAWERMVKANVATQSVWKQSLTGWLGSVPGMIQAAFSGGGGAAGAAKSLASSLVGDLGKNLTGQLGQKIGGSLGGIVGMMGGPIGSMLGSIAGKFAGAAVGKLGGMLGGLFGKDSKETKEVKKLSGEFTTLYGGIENVRALSKLTGVDMEKAFKGKGKAGLEAMQKAAAEFQQKLDGIKKDVGGWADEAVGMGAKLPQSLVPYLAQLEKMGVLTKDHADSLRNLAQNGTVDIEAVKAAADRYGISIAALGPAFQQGVANQNWQQVVDDLRLFEQSGADMNAVLFDMREEISKLVQDSIAFGTSIPANMEPWVRKLMESGELVDANGKKIENLDGITFGDPMIAALDKIVDRFDLLLQGLGLIPKAIDAIPKNVDIEINYREGGRPNPGGIRTEREGDGGVIELPGAAAGGLFSSPAFRVVAEREPEIVGSPNLIVSALAEAMQRNGGGGSGSGGNTVQFNLQTPLATVDTIRQMVYDEIGPVLLDWLENNRGGAQTQMKQILGLG